MTELAARPRHNTIRFAQKKASSKMLKPVVFLVTLIAAISFALVYRTGALDPEPDVLPSAIQRPDEYPTTLSGLTTEISQLISKQPGVYSVRFDDFTSPDAISINEEEVFTAASVIKVPILAATYYLADRGRLDLYEKIEIGQSEIQDWGTGIIRYQTAPVVYTVRELAQVLMEHSDNTAAFVLRHSIIGDSEIQRLVDAWGLSHTDIVENETSNQDMNKLMRMMFEGKIAGPTLSEEMIGWMDDSEFETRLPALLPPEIDVYHKIGNEVQIIHDVGVISLGEDTYYLGVLTSGIVNIEKTEEIIAYISDLVYHYKIRKAGVL